MSHTDPEFLALAALGEHAGTAQDAAHLAQCADCQLALERLTRVVALARQDGPVSLEQPPASVWDRIAEAVVAGEAGQLPDAPMGDTVLPYEARAANGNEKYVSASDPSGVRAAGARRRPGGRRRKVGVAVAGLAAGLIIGIGGTAAVTQLTRPTESTASHVVAEIELRPLAQSPQFPNAAGTAALRQTHTALQLAVSVTAPRQPGFYEVWLLGQNGTSMISLGELDAEHAGTFTLPTGVDLRYYSRIDVSLQPFDGSTQHSKTSVVRGSLPAAATGAAASG